MIDAFVADQRHYLDHLAPVWSALPPERRGRFYAGPKVAARAAALGLDVTPVRRPPSDRWPILVAGWWDYRAVPGRPVVLIEHGVGQPYLGVTHPAHPGGQRRDRVGLYLCPNQSVADRNQAAYPAATVAVVGAPHLDRWHRRRSEAAWNKSRNIFRPKGTPGTDGPIVISWHFDSQVAPEATSAWPHYGPPALQALAQEFPGRLRGHAHPRLLDRLRRVYADCAVPIVDDFAEVLDHAALYICDNSSTMYEAASVGIPVVALNAPWYRRHVEHGLRFWSHVPGPQVDHPDQLVETVRAVLADPGAWAVSAQSAVGAAYSSCDGDAAARAARAVCDWLDQEAQDGNPDTSDPVAVRDHRGTPPGR